jgi:hypothetical protein
MQRELSRNGVLSAAKVGGANRADRMRENLVRFQGAQGTGHVRNNYYIRLLFFSSIGTSPFCRNSAADRALTFKSAVDFVAPPRFPQSSQPLKVFTRVRAPQRSLSHATAAATTTTTEMTTTTHPRSITRHFHT